MGKRLKRLRQRDLNPAALHAWTGTLVDVVLTDGSALHGKLIGCVDGALTVEDALHALEWRDGRHRHVLTFDRIEEIVAQRAAPF